jgi:hypothetical protein
MLAPFQNRSAPSLAVLAAGLLFSACGSGGIPREGAPPEAAKPGPRRAAEAAFTVYRQELRIPLWEEPPPALTAGETPVLTIKLELIDFSGGDPAQEKLLNSVFYRGLGAGDYARDLIRVQTIEYREMGAEIQNNPAMVNSASLNWDYEESLEPAAVSPRLLTISRDRAFYSGGAHPNYDRTYFVFDREAAMRVRLSDIIREESRPALRRLVNRELRAGKKLGPADSLKKAGFFVDEAELSENFFLSPRGLGFHWDPYEIASYAEGYVEAALPFGEIMNLLGPEGRHLVRDLRDGDSDPRL